MQRHRQLDDAQARPKVAARLGDGADDGRADLGAQQAQLLLVVRLQRARALEIRQEGQVATPEWRVWSETGRARPRPCCARPVCASSGALILRVAGQIGCSSKLAGAPTACDIPA